MVYAECKYIKPSTFIFKKGTMNQKSAQFCRRFRKFALDVILLAKELKKHHEYEVASQTIRAATSVGANFYESRLTRSRKELISILSIALREAKETEFWLELINDMNKLSQNRLDPLRKEVDEIIKILYANVKSNQEKLNSSSN